MIPRGGMKINLQSKRGYARVSEEAARGKMLVTIGREELEFRYKN